MPAPHPVRLLTLCAIAFAIGPAGVSAETSNDVVVPRHLIGEHTIVDTLDGTVLSRVRVEVSPRGLRASNSLDGRQAIMNFSLGRHWFVDRTRRMVHEVPVAISKQDEGGEQRRLDGPPGGPARLVSGVFAAEPCYPFQIGTVTRTHWRGRSVQLLDCVDDRAALQAVQYYDDGLRMVIRSVDQRGMAEEFRHIVATPVDDSRFLPPLQFESVDLETFKADRSRLANYATTD